MAGTVVGPCVLRSLLADLRNRFSSARDCLSSILSERGGRPLPAAPLLNKRRSFPAISFALISYFVCWGLVQPKVVCAVSVWFCLIYWGECGERICQLCRHRVFLITKIVCSEVWIVRSYVPAAEECPSSKGVEATANKTLFFSN